MFIVISSTCTKAYCFTPLYFHKQFRLQLIWTWSLLLKLKSNHFSVLVIQMAKFGQFGSGGNVTIHGICAHVVK